MKAEAVSDLRHGNKREKLIHEEGRGTGIKHMVCASQKLSQNARINVVMCRMRCPGNGGSRLRRVQYK